MRNLVFLSVLAVFMAFEVNQKLVRTNVTKEITMLIPKGFRPMDELDFTQRYPSVRKPIAGYTNDSRDVDISINVSATQWPDGNAAIAQKFFKSSLVNMFDGVEMISEGTHTLHGKQFIYFEFESRMRGDKTKLEFRDPVLNYTYIQYLVGQEKTLVFTFTCSRRMRHDWEDAARKIMNSVKIK
jgi:hypothetical protein